MTAVSALFACRPDLVIGGEKQGGDDPESVVVADASTGCAVADAATGFDGSVIGDEGFVSVADAAGDDAGYEVYTFDGALGGICSSVDAGSAAGPAVACGCSRRSGANEAECPGGTGDNANVTLDPQSAATTNLTLEGRQGVASGVAANIQFPPGAVLARTEVQLFETAIAPPNDILDWSPLYETSPFGQALNQPAVIRLPWSNSANAVPADLAIWFSPDGSCFTPLPTSLGNAGFETATISQLGYFIVGNARTSATATCP
jgi:hypothetical protein